MKNFKKVSLLTVTAMLLASCSSLPGINGNNINNSNKNYTAEITTRLKMTSDLKEIAKHFRVEKKGEGSLNFNTKANDRTEAYNIVYSDYSGGTNGTAGTPPKSQADVAQCVKVRHIGTGIRKNPAGLASASAGESIFTGSIDPNTNLEPDFIRDLKAGDNIRIYAQSGVGHNTAVKRVIDKTHFEITVVAGNDHLINSTISFLPPSNEGPVGIAIFNYQYDSTSTAYKNNTLTNEKAYSLIFDMGSGSGLALIEGDEMEFTDVDVYANSRDKDGDGVNDIEIRLVGDDNFGPIDTAFIKGYRFNPVGNVLDDYSAPINYLEGHAATSISPIVANSTGINSRWGVTTGEDGFVYSIRDNGDGTFSTINKVKSSSDSGDFRHVVKGPSSEVYVLDAGWQTPVTDGPSVSTKNPQIIVYSDSTLSTEVARFDLPGHASATPGPATGLGKDINFTNNATTNNPITGIAGPWGETPGGSRARARIQVADGQHGPTIFLAGSGGGAQIYEVDLATPGIVLNQDLNSFIDKGPVGLNASAASNLDNAVVNDIYYDGGNVYVSSGYYGIVKIAPDLTTPANTTVISSIKLYEAPSGSDPYRAASTNSFTYNTFTDSNGTSSKFVSVAMGVDGARVYGPNQIF